MKNLNPTESTRRDASFSNGGGNTGPRNRSTSGAPAENGNGLPDVATEPVFAAPASAVMAPSAELIAAILKVLEETEAAKPALIPAVVGKLTQDSGKSFGTDLQHAAGDGPPIVPGNAVAVLDLRGRSDLELGSFANEVASNLTDNPYVLTPSPTVQEIKDAAKAFLGSLTVRDAALEQAKTLTLLKDQARVFLENLLKSVQLHVQSVSKGDAAVIMSTGLPVKRRRTRTGELSFPTGVVVNPGPVTSTLLISWDAVASSKGFLVQCSVDSHPRQWKLVKRSSHRSLLVEGLEPGTKYVFQVATAGGAKGQSLWSPEVVRVCA